MHFEKQGEVLEIVADQERIDAAAAPAFKSALQENVPADTRRVLVDLSAVKFVDSTGLGVFVSLLKMMGKDGKLAIVGAQPPVLRLFELTGMNRVFRLLGTREEALSALSGA